MKTQEIKKFQPIPKESLNRLHDYFEKVHINRKDDEEPFDIVPPLTKEGALQYQTYQLNDAPESLKEQVKIGRVLMERFVGVVSAAVHAKNPDTPSDQYKFRDWDEATSNLFTSFFTDPETGNKSLKTQVAGLTIAKTVINFACSVIAGDVSAFAKFLKEFGEGLSGEMKKTEGNYNYLYAYSTHGLFEDASGNIFYTPTLDVYGTHFSQVQKKISTSCGSAEKVDLNFAVQTTKAKFKIEQYMADANFKKQVDDFLDRFESKTIKDTVSYFEGIMPARRAERVMLT